MREFVVRRVLIVDDEPDRRGAYAKLALNRASGEGVMGLKTEVAVASTAQEARELLLAANARGVPFHVLVTDLYMRPEDGTRLIQTLPHHGFTSESLDVILVSSKEDAGLKSPEIEAAQAAWSAAAGARFTCVLRADVPDQDETAFANAVWEGLFKQIAPPRSPKTRNSKQVDASSWLEFFVTRHPPLVDWIQVTGLRISRKELATHLTGRSGVGKERLALLLHALSPRASGPFVPVNLTEKPEALFEALMFGWVKGAFTGATSDQVGFIEKAHRGTLFLDEVGDLPKALQPKLLRVLQEGRFEPLGSVTSRSSDFRVITATNRDLRALVRNGEFREDLFHRLCVVSFEIPSLERRPEDIPALLTSLWTREGNGTSLPADVIKELQGRRWDAEVRGLESYCGLLRAFVDDGETVSQRHLVLADQAMFQDRPRIPGIESLKMPLQRILHSWFYPRLSDAIEAGHGIDFVVDAVLSGFEVFFANNSTAARTRINESWRHHKQCCPTCSDLSTRLGATPTAESDFPA